MAGNERIQLQGGVRQRSHHPDIRCLGISQCLQAVTMLQCLQAVTKEAIAEIQIYQFLPLQPFMGEI